MQTLFLWLSVGQNGQQITPLWGSIRIKLSRPKEPKVGWISAQLLSPDEKSRNQPLGLGSSGMKCK
jgi:hypothetical protein